MFSVVIDEEQRYPRCSLLGNSKGCSIAQAMRKFVDLDGKYITYTLTYLPGVSSV